MQIWEEVFIYFLPEIAGFPLKTICFIFSFCPSFPDCSLSLQVAVLGQQVALQREKIRDLESLLESRRNSREVAPPAMAQELAELQHKYAALQRDKMEAERRLRLSNVLMRKKERKGNFLCKRNILE